MKMKRLIQDLNEFLQFSTIHGLPYIAKENSKSTRCIWLTFVLGATIGTSYFLSQTIVGFDEKYTVTNIETRNVKDYPFPAVTFHPGQFNSKKAFMRTFLNQFQFTRCEDDDLLRDNFEFYDQYEYTPNFLQAIIFVSN